MSCHSRDQRHPRRRPLRRSHRTGQRSIRRRKSTHPRNCRVALPKLLRYLQPCKIETLQPCNPATLQDNGLPNLYGRPNLFGKWNCNTATLQPCNAASLQDASLRKDPATPSLYHATVPETCTQCAHHPGSLPLLGRAPTLIRSHRLCKPYRIRCYDYCYRHGNPYTSRQPHAYVYAPTAQSRCLESQQLPRPPKKLIVYRLTQTKKSLTFFFISDTLNNSQKKPRAVWIWAYGAPSPLGEKRVLLQYTIPFEGN